MRVGRLRSRVKRVASAIQRLEAEGNRPEETQSEASGLSQPETAQTEPETTTPPAPGEDEPPSGPER